MGVYDFIVLKKNYIFPSSICLYNKDMPLSIISTDPSPVEVRQHLKSVIHRLKVRGVWHYLEPATRGWLELASRLEGIKFRSQMVLSVLVKILKRVKPLLDFPGLVARIGVQYAWSVSKVAASWGNSDAERWKNDKAFQFYCGLVTLQLSRIIPGMVSSELEGLRELLSFRGLSKVLAILRRIA